MKKFIMGLIVGLILGSVVVTSFAIGAESIWNRVFNSSNNTLNISTQ